MLKTILISALVVLVSILLFWGIVRGRVDDKFSNRADVENWSEEIPSHVPVYLADNVINFSVNDEGCVVIVSSNVMQAEDYYNEFILDGWEVLAPMEFDYVRDSSNIGLLEKEETVVKMSFAHSQLSMDIKD